MINSKKYSTLSKILAVVNRAHSSTFSLTASEEVESVSLKISPEDYTTLKQGIEKVIKEHPVDQYREALIKESKAKDIEKRLRWDYLYGAKIYLPENFVVDTLYKYLNDDHIDSALKNIFKELSGSTLSKILTASEEVEAADPSLAPPKKWWNKMHKQIKEGNPSYSEDQISKTVGDIWYNKLSKSKRKEIREAEGKHYGQATLSLTPKWTQRNEC